MYILLWAHVFQTKKWAMPTIDDHCLALVTTLKTLLTHTIALVMNGEAQCVSATAYHHSILRYAIKRSCQQQLRSDSNLMYGTGVCHSGYADQGCFGVNFKLCSRCGVTVGRMRNHLNIGVRDTKHRQKCVYIPICKPYPAWWKKVISPWDKSFKESIELKCMWRMNESVINYVKEGPGQGPWEDF